jgi:hypothetical protein
VKKAPVIILIVVAVGSGLLFWQRVRPLFALYHQYIETLTPPDQPVISAEEQIRLAKDRFRNEAAARARANVSIVRELLPNRPHDCYVEIAFQAGSGEVDYVWARLISLDDRTITCQILSRPKHYQGNIPSLYSCPASALKDWRVVMPDNTIRGDYTMIVAFENVEKIYGDKMPKPLTVEMQKHIDR